MSSACLIYNVTDIQYFNSTFSQRYITLLVESVPGLGGHYSSRGVRTDRRRSNTRKADVVFGQQFGFSIFIFNVPSKTVTGVFIGGGSPTRWLDYIAMLPNCQIPKISRGHTGNITSCLWITAKQPTRVHQQGRSFDNALMPSISDPFRDLPRSPTQAASIASEGLAIIGLWLVDEAVHAFPSLIIVDPIFARCLRQRDRRWRPQQTFLSPVIRAEENSSQNYGIKPQWMNIH